MALWVSDPRYVAVAPVERECSMGWVIIAVLVAGIAVAFLALRTITVNPGSVVLLYRKGRFERQLEPGYHRWLGTVRHTTTVVVPTVDVPLHGHELSVLTKDQFSFRLTLTPVCKITDAQKYYESQPPVTDARMIALGWAAPSGLNFALLAPALAAATLDQVARFTLEEFISDPVGGVETIREKLGGSVPGAELVDLLVTSIIMPPEVRKMFTEVERARRESLATLERARGEQASLRALANAARAMQSNPQLAQLRMLQTMETAKGAKTFVFGQQAAMNSTANGTPEPD